MMKTCNMYETCNIIFEIYTISQEYINCILIIIVLLIVNRKIIDDALHSQ